MFLEGVRHAIASRGLSATAEFLVLTMSRGTTVQRKHHSRKSTRRQKNRKTEGNVIKWTENDSRKSTDSIKSYGINGTDWRMMINGAMTGDKKKSCIKTTWRNVAGF